MVINAAIINAQPQLNACRDCSLGPPSVNGCIALEHRYVRAAACQGLSEKALPVELDLRDPLPPEPRDAAYITFQHRQKFFGELYPVVN